MTKRHQFGTDSNLRGESLLVQPGHQDRGSLPASATPAPWVLQPLAHQLGLSKRSHWAVSSAVACLLLWCCPTAVLGGVIASVVNPVNAQSGPIAGVFGPGVEHPNGPTPCTAHLYASTTILLIVFVGRLVASSDHATPHSQHRGILNTELDSVFPQLTFSPAGSGAILSGSYLTGEPVGDLHPTHFAERKRVHTSQYIVDHNTAVNWHNKTAPATPLPMGGGKCRGQRESLSLIVKAHGTVCPVPEGEKRRAIEWQS